MAKQRAKELRRRQRAMEKAQGAKRPTDHDPDIEGIVAGPQDPVWKMTGVLTEDEVFAIEREEEEAKERARRRGRG